MRKSVLVGSKDTFAHNDSDSALEKATLGKSGEFFFLEAFK